MITNNSSSNQFRKIAKDIKLGILLYRLYYAPKSFLEVVWRWGALNMWLTNRGKRHMEKATYSLPAIEVDTSVEPLDIYFLTGKKYWYQTCFCAYSMIQQAQTNLRPVIYDDGTLSQIYQDEIIRLFPNAKIVLLEQIETRLDQALPQSKFPYLRERRLEQPLLRKLTDFHAGSTGWKLFLDSDMLFFHPPKFLLNWLKNPQHPCYMVDIKNAYGYSDELMQKITGEKIPDLVNIGIFGLNSENIDWEKLEYWLKILLEKEGTHYNVTQGLSSMYLAGQFCDIAPAEDYILMPSLKEAIHPQVTLHHYVADSKPSYFRYGWRHIVKKSQSS